jgi:hypothetical protein
MFRTKLALAVGALVCLALPAAEPVSSISPGQFKEICAVVKPGKDEDKWASIPWHASLWEARKLAAEKGKPLLLWEMDGNPLGCT